MTRRDRSKRHFFDRDLSGRRLRVSGVRHPCLLICYDLMSLRQPGDAMSIRSSKCSRLISTSAILCWIVCGCSQSVSYRPGDVPRLEVVSQGKQFNLYPAGSSIPMRCAVLRKGDMVGFARSDDGALLGVSGEDRRPLAEASYEWRVMGTKPSPVSGAISKN